MIPSSVGCVYCEHSFSVCSAQSSGGQGGCGHSLPVFSSLDARTLSINHIFYVKNIQLFWPKSEPFISKRQYNKMNSFKKENSKHVQLHNSSKVHRKYDISKSNLICVKRFS